MNQEQLDKDLAAILLDLPMSELITFEMPAEAPQNEDGSVDVNWIELAADVPANIERRTSKEVLGPGRSVPLSYYSIIPQSMPEGLNLLCRVLWNGKQLEITAVQSAGVECVEVNTEAPTT